jgi:hypothetical protein
MYWPVFKPAIGNSRRGTARRARSLPSSLYSLRLCDLCVKSLFFLLAHVTVTTHAQPLAQNQMSVHL